MASGGRDQVCNVWRLGDLTQVAEILALERCVFIQK